MKKIATAFALTIFLTACGGSDATVVCGEHYWNGTIGTCLPGGWHALEQSDMDDRGVPGEVIARHCCNFGSTSAPEGALGGAGDRVRKTAYSAHPKDRSFCDPPLAMEEPLGQQDTENARDQRGRVWPGLAEQTRPLSR